eukprot:34492-Eustigmatos_ZCMA.PRE.1
MMYDNNSHTFDMRYLVDQLPGQQRVCACVVLTTLRRQCGQVLQTRIGGKARTSRIRTRRSITYANHKRSC